MKLKALHTIHTSPTQAFAPGDTFSIEKPDGERLIAGGHAEAVPESSIENAPEVQTEPVAATPTKNKK